MQAKVPEELKKQAFFFVSDSLRGIEKIPTNYGWVFQRCIFHQIKDLQRYVSNRKDLPKSNPRKALLAHSKEFLSTNSVRRKEKSKRTLLRIIKNNEDKLPAYLKRKTREMIRREKEFRAYLSLPEFPDLPSTINTIESFHSLCDFYTAKVNNPKSWHRWCIAISRVKSFKINF